MNSVDFSNERPPVEPFSEGLSPESLDEEQQIPLNEELLPESLREDPADEPLNELPPDEPKKVMPIGERTKREARGELTRKGFIKWSKYLMVALLAGKVFGPFIGNFFEEDESEISLEETLGGLDLDLEVEKNLTNLDKNKLEQINYEAGLKVRDFLENENASIDFLTNLIYSRGLPFEGKKRAEDLEIEISEFTDTDMDILLEKPTDWYLEQRILMHKVEEAIEANEIEGIDLSGIEADGTGLALYLSVRWPNQSPEQREASMILEMILRNSINDEPLTASEAEWLKDFVKTMNFKWRSAIEEEAKP